MESSIRLLACLACVLPSGSFVRTKIDTTENLLNTEVHGEPYAGPQVFRCAAARGSELCQTALSLHGRFRLLGNPRRNDLSLRVERLALADDRRYFCRVEFAGDVHDRYESRHGVRLHVTAAPRIINISVLPGPAHAFRALCTAEGLLGALGLKALLLLGVLAAGVARHRPEHLNTPDTPPRQAQESNYENLSQMNPRSPPAAMCSP
ncbi:Sialic acid-binding Ig-like lectin 15 [Macaca mulatta]|nr:Sialic acid-binding Ig-like lectin 15 [Macaca mulatta]